MAGRDLLANPEKKGRDLLALPEKQKGRDLLAPADDGVNPVPVAEDLPGWDWLRINAPGVFNRGHEFSAGIGDTLSELPNIVPNTLNTAQSLYDLHFGTGTGEVAPEDQFKPWMDDKVGFISRPGRPFAESYPPMPGYEKWRRAGQVSGAALPLGPTVAAVAPVVSAGGGFIGHLADVLTGNTDTQKWERTGEIAAPLVTGGGIKTVTSAPVRAVGRGAVKVAGPVAALSHLMSTGDVMGSLGTAVAVPRAVRTVQRLGTKVAPIARPVANVLGGDDSLGALLARSLPALTTQGAR